MSGRISWCRWVVALGFLLLVGQAPLYAQAAATPTVTLSREEQALWQLVSNARRDAGLSTVTIDTRVSVLSRARSTDMATRDYFDHYTPDGQTFLDLMPRYGLTSPRAGETLQANNRVDSPTEAARALIASPTHHAVLFDPRYTMGGVGHAVDANGIHYFTIIFIQS